VTDTSFCWVHYVHEPVPADVYRICFECKHVYPTAQSLVDAWNREVERINCERPIEDFDGPAEPIPRLTVDQVDRIFFCQECIHDF
jgi:hypothetical protein